MPCKYLCPVFNLASYRLEYANLSTYHLCDDIQGTWRWSNTSLKVFDCPFGIHGCLGGANGGEQSCADGYMGPQCGLCADGWYPQSDGSMCTPCKGQTSISMIQIISMVIAVVIIVGFAGWILSKLMKKVILIITLTCNVFIQHLILSIFMRM